MLDLSGFVGVFYFFVVVHLAGDDAGWGQPRGTGKDPLPGDGEPGPVGLHSFRVSEDEQRVADFHLGVREFLVVRQTIDCQGGNTLPGFDVDLEDRDVLFGVAMPQRFAVASNDRSLVRPLVRTVLLEAAEYQQGLVASHMLKRVGGADDIDNVGVVEAVRVADEETGGGRGWSLTTPAWEFRKKPYPT